MTTPFILGARVSPWGKIAAVGTVQGERYYWLIDRHGVVSMMPAFMVEAAEGPRWSGSHDE